MQGQATYTNYFVAPKMLILTACQCFAGRYVPRAVLMDLVSTHHLAICLLHSLLAASYTHFYPQEHVWRLVQSALRARI